MASRDPERARRVAAQLGIPSVERDYGSLLASDLDCVYIPLPNSEHRRLTLAALGRGKHVLCEKPLALSAVEASEMGAAAEGLGLQLAEAVMYRYHPRWRTLVGLVREGALGSPRHVAGSFSFPLAAGDDYRWRPELGGGALLDIGTYLLSAARWILGAEPERVLARAHLRGGVDEGCDLLLDFGGAGSAALSCSFARAESQWLRVEGSLASLSVPLPFTAWKGERVPLLLESRPGSAPRIVETEAADPYQEMVVHFTSAVLGGPAPVSSAAEAALNLRVADGCRRSWELGAAVELTAGRGPR